MPTHIGGPAYTEAIIPAMVGGVIILCGPLKSAVNECISYQTLQELGASCKYVYGRAWWGCSQNLRLL